MRDAIARNHLRYAVAQDNDYGTWDAWGNQYWPAKYLIDANGQVRYAHFGEGDYDVTEVAIRSLLAEAGAGELGARAGPPARRGARQADDAGDLPRRGARRALAPAAAARRARLPGAVGRAAGEPLRARRALEGRRRVGRGRARRDADARASPASPSTSCSARAAAWRGTSTCWSTASRPAHVTVTRQRLYTLLKLPRTEEHTLTLRFEPGVSGYAFTFG